jgi:hypothetical protein
MTSVERPKLRTKRNASGNLRGRPSGDGTADMPRSTKRQTRPGKTTTDIIQRVVLASRLPHHDYGPVFAFLEARNWPKVRWTGEAKDAIRRWLADPARAAPPEPDDFAPKPARTAARKPESTDDKP